MIINHWVASVGFDPAAYGTHDMRRTNAMLICKRTKPLQAAQLLLRHPKLESTARQLGIEVDDALALSEQPERLVECRHRIPIVWSGGAARAWP